MDYEDIRAVALAYPGVADHTSYGTPSLRVGTRFLLRLREPGIIALRCVGMDERDLLLDTDPGTFFVTDHYRGHPFVLARIARLDPSRFRALFEMIWRTLALKRHLEAHDGQAGQKTAPDSG